MRTNHLNLLLVLVLVLFPMSTRAYGADECVMLYTPYTKIAVPPGESITLNPQLHSRSATYIKRNGLLIRKITIKSSRPFQCAYHPLTP